MLHILFRLHVLLVSINNQNDRSFGVEGNLR